MKPASSVVFNETTGNYWTSNKARNSKDSAERDQLSIGPGEALYEDIRQI